MDGSSLCKRVLFLTENFFLKEEGTEQVLFQLSILVYQQTSNCTCIRIENEVGDGQPNQNIDDCYQSLPLTG